MTKLEAISKVHQSISSIFTKEDVLDILEQIEEKSGISKAQIEDRLETIFKQIDNLNESDVADFDSATFELDYDNRITLLTVEVDLSNIKDIIEENLNNLIEENSEEEGS